MVVYGLAEVHYGAFLDDLGSTLGQLEACHMNLTDVAHEVFAADLANQQLRVS